MNQEQDSCESTAKINLTNIINKDKGWFPVDNQVIDIMQRELKPTEFSVFMLMLRKTIGWNKKKDKISLSQIILFTGLTKNTAREAVKGLVNKRIIEVTREPTSREATEYGICSGDIDFRGSKSDPLEVVRGSKFDTLGGQNLTPQKTIKYNVKPKGFKKDSEKAFSQNFLDDVQFIRDSTSLQFRDKTDQQKAKIAKFYELYKKAIISTDQDTVSLAIAAYAKDECFFSGQAKGKWNFEKLLRNDASLDKYSGIGRTLNLIKKSDGKDYSNSETSFNFGWVTDKEKETWNKNLETIDEFTGRILISRTRSGQIWKNSIEVQND